MLISKKGLNIIEAIRNIQYFFRLKNGTFGCLYNQFDCNFEQKKLDLNNALESCPEYYKNESNRLRITSEEFVRHETTKLGNYFYLAILAG